MEEILTEHCSMKIDKKKPRNLVCSREDRKNRTEINTAEDNLEEINESRDLSDQITTGG